MRLEAPRPRRGMAGLTSLIDVVFLLMIFFMLASSFQQLRALPLQASSGGASASEVPEETPWLLVHVSAAGGLVADGEAVALPALTARLSRRLEETPDLRVGVSTDDAVRLQRLVSVMDRLRGTGARSVVLDLDG